MPVPHQRFVKPGHELGLPVQPNRYRLVTYVGCPWCRRVEIGRRLLGLDAVIAVSVATGKGPDGFIFEGDECGFNRELRVRTTRELYRRQPTWNIGDPTTVPALVEDPETGGSGEIVATSSADLLDDLVISWAPFHRPDAPQLLPQEGQVLQELELFQQWFDRVVAAPFGKILHASDPEEVATAQRSVVEGMEALEARLAADPWLVAGRVSTADVRVFAHLVSLAAYAAGNNYRSAKQAALARGMSDEEAVNVGRLAAQEAPSAFADWPRVQAYFERLAADELWLTAAEKSALHL